MATTPDVFIHPPDKVNDPADIHWTVEGDIAGTMPGWSNYDVEDAVHALLPLDEHFDFATEEDCFFGYTLNEADAKRMVKAIERVVKRPLIVGPVTDDADTSTDPAPDPDAWKQLSDLRDRFTRTWEIRSDIEVTALAHNRNVRLRLGKWSFNKMKSDPRDFTPEPQITDRNVGTMRELAEALLAACDFVEKSNPSWASHPSHGPTEWVD